MGSNKGGGYRGGSLTSSSNKRSNVFLHGLSEDVHLNENGYMGISKVSDAYGKHALGIEIGRHVVTPGRVDGHRWSVWKQRRKNEFFRDNTKYESLSRGI